MWLTRTFQEARVLEYRVVIQVAKLYTDTDQRSETKMIKVSKRLGVWLLITERGKLWKFHRIKIALLPISSGPAEPKFLWLQSFVALGTRS
jgi:hypothetical protein